jgi:hypothetical protein
MNTDFVKRGPKFSQSEFTNLQYTFKDLGWDSAS